MKGKYKLIILFLAGFMPQLKAQFSNPQLQKIDAIAYHFTITINDSTDVIEAIAREQIVLKKNLDSFYLNFLNSSNEKGMNISAVMNRVTHKKLRFEHKNNKLMIYNSGNWVKNDTIGIEIKYSGIPVDGLYIKNNKYGKRTFFGDNWPNRARYWLPIIDHPSDKALLNFTINAPKHYQVVAVGKLLSKKEFTNSNRFVYGTQVPVPTKVMVFAAADFRVKQYAVIKGIPVSSWVFKEAPEKGVDDYKPAISILRFYDSIIGPYSYQKLANIQSKTRFGGMENAGTIFYTEESVNGYNNVEPLIAHEIAHQWFGNSVTEQNWSDLWLSEGFATYMTDIYLEYTYGKERLHQRLKMERDKVIRYSKNKMVQPVVYNESNDLMKMLNRNSYEKGAWILHMLRIEVGDADFFEILRTYYATYKNRNASTADFIRLTESISHKELGWFFEQWLDRKSIPIIHFKWKTKKDKVCIDIRQVGESYQLKLPVQIKGNGWVENRIISIHQQQEHYEFKSKMLTDSTTIQIDPEVRVLMNYTISD